MESKQVIKLLFSYHCASLCLGLLDLRLTVINRINQPLALTTCTMSKLQQLF